jgi:hypothetical protein
MAPGPFLHFVLYHIWYPSYQLYYTDRPQLRLASLSVPLYFVAYSASVVLCGTTIRDNRHPVFSIVRVDHIGILIELFFPVWFQLFFVCQVITK